MMAANSLPPRLAIQTPSRRIPSIRYASEVLSCICSPSCVPQTQWISGIPHSQIALGTVALAIFAVPPFFSATKVGWIRSRRPEKVR